LHRHRPADEGPVGQADHPARVQRERLAAGSEPVHPRRRLPGAGPDLAVGRPQSGRARRPRSAPRARELPGDHHELLEGQQAPQVSYPLRMKKLVLLASLIAAPAMACPNMDHDEAPAPKTAQKEKAPKAEAPKPDKAKDTAKDAKPAPTDVGAKSKDTAKKP